MSVDLPCRQAVCSCCRLCWCSKVTFALLLAGCLDGGPGGQNDLLDAYAPVSAVHDAPRPLAEHIGTKTAVQIRSHAQKFFSKLEREQAAGNTSGFRPPPRLWAVPPRLVDCSCTFSNWHHVCPGICMSLVEHGELLASQRPVVQNAVRRSELTLMLLLLHSAAGESEHPAAPAQAQAGAPVPAEGGPAVQRAAAAGAELVRVAANARCGGSSRLALASTTTTTATTRRDNAGSRRESRIAVRDRLGSWSRQQTVALLRGAAAGAQQAAAARRHERRKYWRRGR